MRLPPLLALFATCTPLLAATPTETLAQFHQALADGEAGQASALLDPAIQIYESGYVERSREEYAGHHLKADIAFARTTSNTVLKQSERVDGKLAVVMRETETTGQYKGSPVHLLGVETALLEQRGDRWVITHLHWSSRKPK
ncbi:MAG TPA: nuclear transport factor 2 family protein [Burkholderiaceae bacterium]|nr:nuclear transport factor 2 family protein [Burkholderiaceae bacterium]